MEVAALAQVVKVNGRVPRRAVLLPGGVLGDRAAHPSEPEADLVSRVCEIVRRATGQAVFPRRTSELLERALAENCPGAWEAVRDDLLTADLDLDAAAVVLRQTPNPSALVGCLLGARDNDHFVHIACLLARTLDRLSEEALAEFGRALTCHLRALLDCLATRGGLMTRDVRDAMLDGFGRVLGTVPLGDSRVAESLLYIAETKADDLFRLFLHVPPSFVDHRPQIAPMLVERARAAACKYPPVMLLARVAEYRPEIREGNEEAMADIVRECLSKDQVDCRDCLAVAALAEAVCGDGLSRALAGALRQCADSVHRARKAVKTTL